MAEPEELLPLLALTELAAFVGSLRRWVETHPNDQEAPVLLARASAEFEVRVKPWRDALDGVFIQLAEETDG